MSPKTAKKTVAALVVITVALVGSRFLLGNTYPMLSAISLVLAAILAVACVVLRVLTGMQSDRPNYPKYEKAYAEYIGDAFHDRRARYNRLLRQIGRYNHRAYKKAIRGLKRLESQCTAKEDYIAVRMFLALCYSDSGQADRAIETYQRLLDDAPQVDSAWSNLSILYGARGQIEEAKSACLHALKIREDNPYSLNNLAYLCIAQRKAKEALTYAEDALAINPDMPEALSAAGIAAAMLGDRAAAESYYRRTEKCSPALGKQLRKMLDAISAGDLSVLPGGQPRA